MPEKKNEFNFKKKIYCSKHIEATKKGRVKIISFFCIGPSTRLNQNISEPGPKILL